MAAAGRIVDGTFRCNVLKVQHHGSEHNLSTEFARTVLADDYVFCADGANHNPDPSVVKTIVETRRQADRGPFTLWFNCSPPRAAANRRAARKQAISEATAAAAVHSEVSVNVLDERRAVPRHPRMTTALPREGGCIMRIRQEISALTRSEGDCGRAIDAHERPVAR